MAVRSSIAVALTLALTTTSSLHGHAPESVWAAPQQAKVAQDILYGDGNRLSRALFVVEALGRSRTGDDIRLALVSRLDEVLDELSIAAEQGITLQEVIDGEILLDFAETLASLEDPSSIPVLVRATGHLSSHYIERGLASFGEEALPAILEAIDAPDSSDWAVRGNLSAIFFMLEGDGAAGLSRDAHQEIVRVALKSFHGKRPGAISAAIDIAIALNEPDLIREVESLASDNGTLSERGISMTSADWIRKNAANALAGRRRGG